MRVEHVALTLPELNHLFHLLCDNERTGEYYGTKRQYRQRHKRIVKKLEAAACAQYEGRTHTAKETA